MDLPEFFKYSSLLSVPLFGGIALLLFRHTKNYSPGKQTLSQSILFLKTPASIMLFRLNFLLKALLDLCFALYVFDFLHIPFASPIAFLLISSAVLFGSLAYVVEGKFTRLHAIIIYTSGHFWAIGQLLVVRILGNNSFTIVSDILILTPVIVGSIFLFLQKTNVFIQTVCMVLWYTWLLIFVFYYL